MDGKLLLLFWFSFLPWKKGVIWPQDEHPMSPPTGCWGKKGAIHYLLRHLNPVSILSSPPADKEDKLINTRRRPVNV